MSRVEGLARDVLDGARKAHMMIATAESCTGGLVAGALTEVPGSSDVVDRGFVTYTNTAKIEMLGVDPATLDSYGAVSEQVASQMATGALSHSQAQMAVSITGIAGPGGGSSEKPVGLVWFGLATGGSPVKTQMMHFGDIGRSEVRARSVEVALNLLRDAV